MKIHLVDDSEDEPFLYCKLPVKGKHVCLWPKNATCERCLRAFRARYEQLDTAISAVFDAPSEVDPL